MVHLAYLGQGNNYHVRKWLPALVDEGLRVTLISFSEPAEPIRGVEFRRIQPPFGVREPKHLLHFWGSPAPLRQLLEEIDADVLMASYATNYGFLGARTGFRPLIAQTWTADLTVYPWSGWKRLILKPLVRRALLDADIITTDGEGLAEQGRRLFPDLADRITSVRWGIRTADFDCSEDVGLRARASLGIPAGATVVTSPRGVLAWYRPKVILEGLLAFLESSSDAHSIFLTLGRERDLETDSLLARYAEHPRAHLVDRFIPSDRIHEIWAATDILISIPVVDGISEGLLEGMYCGCIPLVSDIPSNRSIIEDSVSGVILSGDPESPQDLKANLDNVIERLDHLKSKVVPRNTKWVAEHASVEATARQMAETIKGLAGFA